MEFRFVPFLISTVVAVLLVATLALPFIADVTESESTIKNTGMPYAAAGEDHVIIVTSDGVTFDGDVVDTSLFPAGFTSFTLVYGEESLVRWGIGSNVLTASDADGVTNFNIGTATITITITGSTVTVTTSASATTFTASDVIFYMSPKGGDYVLAVNPYVNDESVVYAAGDTFFAGTSGRPGTLRVWIVWQATLDDVTVNAYGYNGAAYTGIQAPEVTADVENINTNLYRYNSVVFDFTVSATVDGVPTDFLVSSTYTYFLAPAVVTYDNPSYVGDSTLESLIGIIPILLFVGIVLGVIAIFARRAEIF